ncbi:MAG: hypothetical protein GC160_29235 [Acidobacteria bacterium]|nr:hypothetical protein [Acidobacteriota bacterium]
MRFVYSSLVALAALSAPLAAEDELPNRMRSAAAIQPHQAPGGATVWVDPTDWTWVRSDREDTVVFVYKTGLAQARLVVSDQPAKPETMKEDLLARLTKLDPEPKLLFEEQRRVNGVDYLCVQVEVQSQDKKRVVFYGLAHGDEKGSYEFFTIMGADALSVYYQDMTEMLDGLQIPGSTEASQ